MPLRNDYTTQALIDRVTLKARTSTATSLTPQEIINLANDSLHSYLVPLTQTLREEWWVGREDIVLTTDSDGAVQVPDSVASTLRTVAWNNGGVITPLTRIEPEVSYAYRNSQGNMPVGFELRGYTLLILPKAPNIALHITAMLRPPQMVLTEEAAQVSSNVGSALTLASVPNAWQSAAPSSVHLVSAVSPFRTVATLTVVSLVGSVLTVASVSSAAQAAITAGAWVSEVGASPFANIPIELYPLLEQDVVCTLFQAVGDKRGADAVKRKGELEALAKRSMAPRAQGNCRPIVNPNAPGMRGYRGRW